MTARLWLARVAKWALFVLVAVMLMPQPGFRGAPAALLSPAQYAVDLASQSGNVDPSSTVFALGPLSRMATRAPQTGRGWILVFDLLVAAAVVYGLFLLFRRANSVEALLGILAGALVVEGVRSYVFPLAVILWLVMLVVLVDYGQRETLLSLLAAAGLSWLLFYLQSSVGLAALAMVAVVLVFRLVWPGARQRRFTTVVLAAWLLIGPLLALALGIDLPAHIANALRLRSLVAAPAPAYATGGASGSAFMLLALTILLIFAGTLAACWRALRGQPEQAVDWLACGLTAALLLLAFREAFVRPWGHPWLFFQAAAAAVGVLALVLTTRVAARRFGGAFVAMLILSFPVVSANVQVDYLNARVATLRSYAAWALNKPQPDVSDARLDAYLIRPRLQEIVDKGTVDATAELLPSVVASDLAFQPSASVRSLADLPLEIGSSDGPRFIMLGLDDDPAHDPFPAGSAARLGLLRDYRVIWRLGDALLLLERLQRPLAVTLAESQSGVERLGHAVLLSTPGGIQRLQADLDLSLAGRIAQAVALAQQVELVTQYDDGGRESARLTADQLRTGVQLAPVVTDLGTAELFLSASGHLNRPVEQFWLETAQPWAFRSQFDYTVESFASGNTISEDWPLVTLNDGQQLRLVAVQYDLDQDAVVLNVFWEVNAETLAPGLALDHLAFARLLDARGDSVASAALELRDRAPGLRTLASGSRRFLAARLLLPQPPNGETQGYDLEVGLTPAGQPPESAVWRTVLPGFVQTLPSE